MNETIHTLITRRSVRKYKKAQISDEDLYLILQAGTYAASGHGLQPCTIVVIQDTDTLARLSALNAKIMGTTSDPMYGAPTVQPSRLKKRRTPISSSSPTCPSKPKSSMPART